MQCTKFVAQLHQLPEADGTISALVSHGTMVFAGTTTGQVQAYRVSADGSERSLFTTLVARTTLLEKEKRKIAKLDHSPSRPLLFALCGKRLFVLDAASLSVLREMAPNIGTFAVSTVPSRIGSGFRADPYLHLVTCGIHNERTVVVFEYDAATNAHTQVQELVLPEPLLAVTERAGLLCLGMRREYSMLSLKDGDAKSLLGLPGGATPLIVAGGSDVFLRLGERVFIVSMKAMPSTGQALKKTVRFDKEPRVLVSSQPFLFSFGPTCCYVYSSYDDSVVEELPLPDCQFASPYVHNNSIFCASRRNIWLIRIASLENQLEQLVAAFKIDDAFHLLQSQPVAHSAGSQLEASSGGSGVQGPSVESSSASPGRASDARPRERPAVAPSISASPLLSHAAGRGGSFAEGPLLHTPVSSFRDDPTAQPASAWEADVGASSPDPRTSQELLLSLSSVPADPPEPSVMLPAVRLRHLDVNLHVMSGFAFLYRNCPGDATRHLGAYVDIREVLLHLPDLLPRRRSVPAAHHCHPDLAALTVHPRDDPVEDAFWGGMRPRHVHSRLWNLYYPDASSLSPAGPSGPSRLVPAAPASSDVRAVLNGAWTSVYFNTGDTGVDATRRSFDLTVYPSLISPTLPLATLVEPFAGAGMGSAGTGIPLQLTLTEYLLLAEDRLKEELLLWLRSRLQVVAPFQRRAAEHALLALFLQRNDRRSLYLMCSHAVLMTVADAWGLLSSPCLRVVGSTGGDLTSPAAYDAFVEATGTDVSGTEWRLLYVLITHTMGVQPTAGPAPRLLPPAAQSFFEQHLSLADCCDAVSAAMVGAPSALESSDSEDESATHNAAGERDGARRALSELRGRHWPLVLRDYITAVRHLYFLPHIIAVTAPRTAARASYQGPPKRGRPPPQSRPYPAAVVVPCTEPFLPHRDGASELFCAIETGDYRYVAEVLARQHHAYRAAAAVATGLPHQGTRTGPRLPIACCYAVDDEGNSAFHILFDIILRSLAASQDGPAGGDGAAARMPPPPGRVLPTTCFLAILTVLLNHACCDVRWASPPTGGDPAAAVGTGFGSVPPDQAALAEGACCALAAPSSLLLLGVPNDRGITPLQMLEFGGTAALRQIIAFTLSTLRALTVPKGS